jgi:hypothetical protein
MKISRVFFGSRKDKVSGWVVSNLNFWSKDDLRMRISESYDSSD